MPVSVGAVTVSSVLPLIRPSVAEIVLGPGLRAFARPPPPIVATAVLDEPQVTEPVRFAVEPFQYVPVAANCRVVPATFVWAAGVTAMLFSVAPVTVSNVLPLTSPTVAEIVLVPALTPLANPLALTVATASLVDVQVTDDVRSMPSATPE